MSCFANTSLIDCIFPVGGKEMPYRFTDISSDRNSISDEVIEILSRCKHINASRPGPYLGGQVPILIQEMK